MLPQISEKLRAKRFAPKKNRSQEPLDAPADGSVAGTTTGGMACGRTSVSDPLTSATAPVEGSTDSSPETVKYRKNITPFRY